VIFFALQPEQERAKEGMIEQKRRAHLADALGRRIFVSDLKHKLALLEA
jgi:hypothetical protein